MTGLHQTIRIKFIVLVLLYTSTLHVAAQQYYEIHGQIRDKQTNEPIPYASVLLWNTSNGSTADSTGKFILKNIQPGIYRVQATSLGYLPYSSSEFKLTARNLAMDIEMERSKTDLKEVSVTAGMFRPSPESPISMRIIGVQEIEKSAGANRDISKVVNSFPGVASTVGGGYRNDLLVRGGGPMENRFYLDGVEIPNINHFSTQGASGGPMGIIDADFIRDVGFYTGAFPAGKGNALSSILDFKLLDGNKEKNSYKATVGASELALSSNGHIGSHTTYLVSVRQSYLQLLFTLLKMPFLPKYTDAQFKIKTRFNQAHELTLLGIGAIDDMKLNQKADPEDEGKQYILSYLPVIKQKTYTLGAVYKHYGGNHVQTVVLSRNYMNNNNIKYRDNDKSSLDNLTLKYNSDEIENHLRFENISTLRLFRIQAGANIDYATYRNTTFQRIFASSPKEVNYHTFLKMFKWGIFVSGSYELPDSRFSASLGIRTDANNYSSQMNNPVKQISPRLSLSYGLTESLFINGNIGRYYQLPAYTTLGYKNNDGTLVNRHNGLSYIRSDQVVAGLEYRVGKNARITAEGFYKKYDNAPLSLTDSIPLACKGVDYGASGNEAASSSSEGRAYGTELMIRWYGSGKFTMLASYTWYRSEFRNPKTRKFIPTAWDNRHLVTVSGTYKFKYNWDFGLKFRLMGGAPYTPYDEYTSSVVTAWNASSRPYYDYSRYNSERLKTFTQIDVRLDKSFYRKGLMIGLYIDLQNVLNTKYNNQPVLRSTGEKYTDDHGTERYKMKYIDQKSGIILPTLGVTVEF